jgi:hypothetical protein
MGYSILGSLRSAEQYPHSSFRFPVCEPTNNIVNPQEEQGCNRAEPKHDTVVSSLSLSEYGTIVSRG